MGKQEKQLEVIVGKAERQESFTNGSSKEDG
jgi:hypothetical protein